MTNARLLWTRARKAWDMTVGRVLGALLVGAILLYQRFLSPHLGQNCRYYPSCSSYALGAVRTHGPVKGSLLTVGRLARCNPWSPGGVDHVPDRGAWRGDKRIRPSTSQVGS